MNLFWLTIAHRIGDGEPIHLCESVFVCMGGALTTDNVGLQRCRGLERGEKMVPKRWNMYGDCGLAVCVCVCVSNAVVC